MLIFKHTTLICSHTSHFIHPPSRSIFKMGGIPISCKKLANIIRCLWRSKALKTLVHFFVKSGNLLVQWTPWRQVLINYQVQFQVLCDLNWDLNIVLCRRAVCQECQPYSSAVAGTSQCLRHRLPVHYQHFVITLSPRLTSLSVDQSLTGYVQGNQRLQAGSSLFHPSSLLFIDFILFCILFLSCLLFSSIIAFLDIVMLIMLFHVAIENMRPKVELNFSFVN